jgi:hypothetical protein
MCEKRALRENNFIYRPIMDVRGQRVQLFIIFISLIVLQHTSGAWDLENVRIYEKIDRAGGVQSGGADDLGNLLQGEIMREFMSDVRRRRDNGEEEALVTPAEFEESR